MVRAYFARDSTAVFAAAYGGGLYQSNDAGASWSEHLAATQRRYLTAAEGNGSWQAACDAPAGRQTLHIMGSMA